jgi:DeoR/GlpR family transcriptional regulator of sugar metabolism
MDHSAAIPEARQTTRRRAAILELLRQDRQVNVASLSRHFGVSEVAIRRDLDYLQDAGLLLRIHGGARLLPAASSSPIFDARILHNVQCKRAIGAAAAQLVLPGEVVMFDSGTTVLEVARHLPRPLLENGSLTLITRSLAIASELRTQRGARLILLGGVYMPEYDSFFGSQVETAVKGLHANTLFIGAEGVTVERGLTTDNLVEESIYRLLAAHADRVVVVTDSSKIGASKLQLLLPFEVIHTFITDSGAPEDMLSELRQRGIQVITVPRPAGC